MIKDLRDYDKPRERLIREGRTSLSDIEILAILINSGTKKYSALDLANMILKKYSLNELINISYEELAKIAGIKQSKASKIIASFELARRALIRSQTELNFDNPETIFKYMQADYLYLDKEIFYVLLLDNHLSLIKKIKLGEGTNFQVNFTLKQLIECFVRYKAYAFVICHNHPSGKVSPSRSDIKTTLEIKRLMNDLGYLLIDHLIVGKNNYFSFEENKLLENR